MWTVPLTAIRPFPTKAVITAVFLGVRSSLWGLDHKDHHAPYDESRSKCSVNFSSYPQFHHTAFRQKVKSICWFI